MDHNRRFWCRRSQLVDHVGSKHLVFTNDISHTGMSLFADKEYKPGQVCNVAVPEVEGTVMRHYTFSCRVVFSSLCGMKGFRTNLEFLEMSPENKTFIQSMMSQY